MTPASPGGTVAAPAMLWPKETTLPFDFRARLNSLPAEIAITSVSPAGGMVSPQMSDVLLGTQTLPNRFNFLLAQCLRFSQSRVRCLEPSQGPVRAGQQRVRLSHVRREGDSGVQLVYCGLGVARAQQRVPQSQARRGGAGIDSHGELQEFDGSGQILLEEIGRAQAVSTGVIARLHSRARE